MGVSFAGIDLLIDDKDGKAQEWLNRFLPTEDGRMIVEWDRLKKPENFAGTTAGCYTGQGTPPLNYSRPQRPKISVWYQPTGASRWGYGFFFCDYARLKAIQSQFSNTGTSGTLLLTSDSAGKKYSRGFLAFMLPPHPISTNAFADTSLWILPLVDERYYWQFLTAFIQSPNSPPIGGIVDATSPTLRDWQYFFNTAGFTVSNDAVNTAYLRPNYFALSSIGSYTSAAVVMDMMAHSVGQRIVPKYPARNFSTIYGGGAWQSIGYSSSVDIRTVNLAHAYDLAMQQVGTLFGTYPALGALAPSSVSVYFRPWANGIVLPDWYQNRYVKTLTAASIIGTQANTGSYTKTFTSTALANYTSGAAVPDNQATLDALANQIAVDFYNLSGWIQDSIVAGISQWQETAFDDYVEFDVGWLNPATGERQARTRIHSVPYNFSCETLLHYDSTTWEHGDRIVGTLNGNLAAGGTQTINVSNADSPLPSGTTTLTVTSLGAITGTTGSTVHAIRERNVWAVVSASTAGTGGNCSVYEAAPAAVQVAGTSGTFNKSGGGTITANVLEGVCIPANNYLVVTDGTTAWVSNPDMMIVGQSSTVVSGGNSCTVTLYGGTQGAETSLTTTVTAYVRRGFVVTGRTYELSYEANGWEVTNPDATCIARPSAIVQNGNSATFNIYTGTQGSESASGVTLSGFVRRGLVFSDTNYFLGQVANGFEVLNPSLVVRGQTTADVMTDTTGTLTIYTGTGAGTSSGVSISGVRNDTSCTVKTGKLSYAEWCDSLAGWAFDIFHSS